MIVAALEDFFQNHHLQNRPCAIAFSGGKDSVALALALDNSAYREQLTSLLYYNHNLRPIEECQKEEAFVTSFAKTRGLPLVTASASQGEIKKWAQKHSRGIEESARHFRYAFFQENLPPGGVILTAHHQQDLIEQQIMRFFSGAGLTGLQGIPEVREPFYRPLLQVPLDRILQFLHQNKAPWSEDSTNKESDFLRNKVRNQLLPQLEEIFPHCSQRILSVSKDLQEAHQALESMALPQWKIIPGGFSLPCKEFEPLPPYLRRKLLLQVYNLDESQRGRQPSRRMWERVTEVRSLPQGNLIQTESFLLRRKRDMLFWDRIVVNIGKNEYLIPTDPERWYQIGERSVKISTQKDGIGPLFLDLHTSFLRTYMPSDTIVDKGRDVSLNARIRKVGVSSDEVILLGDSQGIVLAIGPQGQILSRRSQGAGDRVYLVWKEDKNV